MPTAREQIMQSVAATLQSELAPTVIIARNADAPVDVPDGGYIIVRDAEPTIEDSTLGPQRVYFMRLDIPVEVYAGGDDEADRSILLDDLCDSAATAIAASASLANLAHHVETTISSIETLVSEGAATTHAAQLLVSVEYDSAESIG
jgi:hypothetical protein